MSNQLDLTSSATCPDCKESTSIRDAIARGWHIDADSETCQCAVCYRVNPWFREFWNAQAEESTRAYLAKLSKNGPDLPAEL